MRLDAGSSARMLLVIVLLVVLSAATFGCQPDAPATPPTVQKKSAQQGDSAEADGQGKQRPDHGTDGSPGAPAGHAGGSGDAAKDIPLEDVGKCLSACGTMSGEGPGGGMRGLCSAGCYTAQAKREKDPDICDKRMVGEMAGMHDICLSSVADEAGDPDICDRIESKILSSSCRMNVAKRLKDRAPCKKIEDAAMRAQCEAAVKE